MRHQCHPEPLIVQASMALPLFIRPPFPPRFRAEQRSQQPSDTNPPFISFPRAILMSKHFSNAHDPAGSMPISRPAHGLARLCGTAYLNFKSTNRRTMSRKKTGPRMKKGLSWSASWHGWSSPSGSHKLAFSPPLRSAALQPLPPPRGRDPWHGQSRDRTVYNRRSPPRPQRYLGFLRGFDCLQAVDVYGRLMDSNDRLSTA